MRDCHGDMLLLLLLLTMRKVTCQHKSNETTARQRLQRLWSTPYPCARSQIRVAVKMHKKKKFSSHVLLVSKGKGGKAEKLQLLLWCSGALKSILMQVKARSWGRPSSRLISPERWHQAFQDFCYKDTTLPLLIYSWATWDLIRIFHKLLLGEITVENQRQ